MHSLDRRLRLLESGDPAGLGGPPNVITIRGGLPESVQPLCARIPDSNEMLYAMLGEPEETFEDRAMAWAEERGANWLILGGLPDHLVEDDFPEC